MHRGELSNVEPIRQHTVGLAFEQVLALKGRDMRDGCENVARVGGGSLNAVTVVYTTLSGFRINIEPLQVVIKVNRTGAKVAT